MADDLDLLRRGIELYRANYATPENLEAMRFWVQGELNRIQSGFSSADEAVRLIADLISTGGGTGEDGADGRNGVDGAPGRSIQVFEQSGTPVGAYPGDIWIKVA